MTLIAPPSVIPPPAVISGASRIALAGMIANSGPTIISNQSATANQAQLVPFTLSEPYQALRAFAAYGLVSGNIDLGIYDAEYRRLFSTGSQAASGANSVQLFTVDWGLAPGTYHLAVACDNGTLQIRGMAFNAQWQRAMGVVVQGSAFPLPSTVTPAAVSGTNFLFGYGITTRTVI